MRVAGQRLGGPIQKLRVWSMPCSGVPMVGPKRVGSSLWLGLSPLALVGTAAGQRRRSGLRAFFFFFFCGYLLYRLSLTSRPRPMADADDVRRLALALPGVSEIDSDGFDFRVDGKGFVWSYPERRPGQRRVIRTDIAVLFVGDEAEKQALLLGEPGIFFTAPGYDGWPLVLVRLAEVDAARLEELVTDAWRMRAHG